jgi:hypothetical protein
MMVILRLENNWLRKLKQTHMFGPLSGNTNLEAGSHLRKILEDFPLAKKKKKLKSLIIEHFVLEVEKYREGKKLIDLILGGRGESSQIFEYLLLRLILTITISRRHMS